MRMTPRMRTVMMVVVGAKFRFDMSDNPCPFIMLEMAVSGMLRNGTVKVSPSWTTYFKNCF